MSDALDLTDAELCVERLAAHQRERRLSDASLVRLCPSLGSARTWRRMAARDWSALPLDVWLPRLREALALIDDTAAGSQPGPGQPPAALVTRHLVEADRCHREGEISLARSHCRAARQAIEQYQRLLRPATSTPATP
ncbi:MAG TPA: hypothetical protein PKY38_09230 [Opitutaceae bacterium]|nr:hypothetical protein [Opitutaceae bacterium]